MRAPLPGLTVLCLLASALALLGCAGDPPESARSESSERSEARGKGGGGPTESEADAGVYAATRAGNLAPATHGVPYRVYVPNSESDTVTVIEPEKKEVIKTFPVGGLPQHVTPSPDLRTLYVNSNQGNTLTRIDPRTARPQGEPIPVEDPYNLYFTPTGTRLSSSPSASCGSTSATPRPCASKRSCRCPARV